MALISGRVKRRKALYLVKSPQERNSFPAPRIRDFGPLTPKDVTGHEKTPVQASARNGPGWSRGNQAREVAQKRPKWPQLRFQGCSSGGLGLWILHSG